MTATYAPSANVADLQESATIAVSARARALKAAGRPVIDLGAGEPDFPTPAYIRDAARRAIDAGATRYTLVEGILSLREVIADRVNERSGASLEVSAAQVVISTGSKQSLFNACFVLFGAGDEVLVPTPGWTSYYEMVSLARAQPVAVRGAREHALKITPADLEAAASPRTRGLILNSPTNPTGAVYDLAELRALLAYAEARDWWVISDEIYRQIAYDAPAPSLLDAASDRARAKLIVVDGVAKAYSMTGWRIGWSISSLEVARAMTALQSHTTSNASTVSQHATLAALTQRAEGDRAIESMVGEFRRRRDAAVSLLRRAGVDFIEPHGAFYLYLRVPAASGAAQHESGATFARRLLETRDVAIVPGAAFHTPEWVRLSYAAPMEDVMEGVRRIVDEIRGEGLTKSGARG
jgi:aspartate aminotransferase